MTELNDAFSRIKSKFAETRDTFADKEVEDIGLVIPVIHNVHRWWRRDVLKELLILRQAIRSECSSPDVQAFFLLSLAAVLVPDLSNVTLGRLQLHFVDKSKKEMNVWPTFEAHTRVMLEDISAIPDEKRSVSTQILWIDSTSDDVLKANNKVDRVITSPPYPNRYSYVWNTRPHLYMLELFQNSKQASDLDLVTIGGTWGTATSILKKGIIEPVHPVLESVVMPVSAEIRKDDNLMANYLTNYFNGMVKQILSQNRILAKKAKCAYVVGCSRLKGIYVETDVLLGKVFEGLDIGFKVDRIERIRKRNSGENLHESIVYVTR